MNRIIIAMLFTMLLVSCGTPLPSESESSLVSQGPSSSIETTSTATSSSEISSSSTSYSSSSNPTSSTPSSSEEPVINRKVPFNQISSLVAQVVDAKAMGIVNSKDRHPQVNGRRNAQSEDQNYMVKVTETYDPNTQITEDQTIQVTFTRVTNTQTTELQTGISTHVATADTVTIERVTDLPGNIVITNVIGHEFRLFSGETVIQDWISSDQETIEFIFDEALTDIVIESRSLNASISFTTFEDFTYTIKQGEQAIYEDILDNDSVDNNEAVGAMTISGLTEGLAYDVTYAGYQVVETITQAEVEGQVDKLYVLYQYTFVSFVPLNNNPRPQNQDLELDYDDIPLYDKTGFYSNSTRQSFVVNNNTGLIYKIEGINIASLSGGCVAVQNNPFPFDLRITEEGLLEFYSLFQNQNITTYYCFKDKFGQKFVSNNRINTIDQATKTVFFVFQNGRDFLYNKNISYVMTETNQVLKVTINHQGTTDTYADYYRSAYLINNNFEESNFNFDNKIKIYDSYYSHSQNSIGQFEMQFAYGTKIFSSGNSSTHFYSSTFTILALYSFDAKTTQHYRITSRGNYLDNSYSGRYIKEDVLLSYYNNNVYAFYNIYDSFISLINSLDSSELLNYLDIYVYSPNLIYSHLDSHDFFTSSLLLSNVVIANESSFNFIQEGLQGSTTFELILEKFQSNIFVKAYPIGTYTAPPTTSTVLQPINR